MSYEFLKNTSCFIAFKFNVFWHSPRLFFVIPGERAMVCCTLWGLTCYCLLLSLSFTPEVKEILLTWQMSVPPEWAAGHCWQPPLCQSHCHCRLMKDGNVLFSFTGHMCGVSVLHDLSVKLHPQIKLQSKRRPCADPQQSCFTDLQGCSSVTVLWEEGCPWFCHE